MNRRRSANSRTSGGNARIASEHHPTAERPRFIAARRAQRGDACTAPEWHPWA